MRSNTQKIKLHFSRGGLERLTRCVADLSKLGDTIKMKFERDGHVMIYSLTGVAAFKAVVFKLSDLLSRECEEFETDYVLANHKRFVLDTALLGDTDVSVTLSSKQGARYSHEIALSDGRLTLKYTAGEPGLIKDITRHAMLVKMDPNLSNFQFSVSNEDIARIKKLAKSSPTALVETVMLTVKDGNILLGDTKWSLSVADNVPAEDAVYLFNKKYVSSISVTDHVIFHVFDHFMLIVQCDTYLMIGLELDEL